MYKEGRAELKAIYNAEIDNEKILTKEEELELFKKYKNNDISAKNKLIKSNLRLVRYIVGRYNGNDIDYMDLIQEGNLSLIKAVETFDISQGYKFSTYAKTVITRDIISYLNKKRRIVRLPGHIEALINKYHRTERKLEQELLREPSVKEIAKALNVESERLIDAMQLEQSFKTLNLDMPVNNENEDFELKDTIYDEKEIVEEKSDLIKQEEMEILDEVLTNELKPRERYVLIERLGYSGKKGRSLDSLSKELNISRERVRQIQNRAIEKLQTEDNLQKLKMAAHWIDCDKEEYKSERVR